MRIVALVLGIVGGLIGLVSGASLGAGVLILGLFGAGLVEALLALIALALAVAAIISGIIAALRPRPGGVLMLVVGVGILVVYTLLSLSLQAKGVTGEGLWDNAYWLAGALLILGGILGLRAKGPAQEVVPGA